MPRLDSCLDSRVKRLVKAACLGSNEIYYMPVAAGGAVFSSDLDVAEARVREDPLRQTFEARC